MQIGFLMSLLFAIIVAVFALQNSEKVLISYLFGKVEVSQAIIIFVSAALGAVIVTILGIIRQIKLSIKIKEQSKKIKLLEEVKIQLENRIEELTSNIENQSQNYNDRVEKSINLEVEQQSDKDETVKSQEL